MLLQLSLKKTLKERLIDLGWTSDDIREEIIDAHAECMETFYMCEDDDFNEIINEIIIERFGFACDVEELFKLYDELN